MFLAFTGVRHKATYGVAHFMVWMEGRTTSRIMSTLKGVLIGVMIPIPSQHNYLPKSPDPPSNLSYLTLNLKP